VQLKEIIENEMKTDQGTSEVQEHDDGEEVLVPDNTSSVLTTVLNTINNEFKHECPAGAVRLLNVHSICQSTDDLVPGHMYSIPSLPETEFLAHQVSAILFIVWRMVCNADMPVALAADEMGLGKTFTLVAVGMLCKLVTEKVVMGLPQSIL
jgi:hypothetical protein